VLVDDLGEIAPERALARADDPAADTDTVGVGDRRRMVERRLQRGELGVEVRVQRQLSRYHERRDEDHSGAAVAGETAGEIEGVLGLVSAQQRNDDAAVADRRRPPGETPGAPPERADVEALH